MKGYRPSRRSILIESDSDSDVEMIEPSKNVAPMQVGNIASQASESQYEELDSFDSECEIIENAITPRPLTPTRSLKSQAKVTRSSKRSDHVDAMPVFEARNPYLQTEKQKGQRPLSLSLAKSSSILSFGNSHSDLEATPTRHVESTPSGRSAFPSHTNRRKTQHSPKNASSALRPLTLTPEGMVTSPLNTDNFSSSEPSTPRQKDSTFYERPEGGNVQWIEKHPPQSVDDVCTVMSKKKVEEVSSWIETALDTVEMEKLHQVSTLLTDIGDEYAVQEDVDAEESNQDGVTIKKVEVPAELEVDLDLDDILENFELDAGDLEALDEMNQIHDLVPIESSRKGSMSGKVQKSTSKTSKIPTVATIPQPPPRILVVAGPAGIGKSTCIQVLAKELQFRLIHWIDPNSRGIGSASHAMSSLRGGFPPMSSSDDFFSRSAGAGDRDLQYELNRAQYLGRNQRMLAQSGSLIDPHSSHSDYSHVFRNSLTDFRLFLEQTKRSSGLKLAPVASSSVSKLSMQPTKSSGSRAISQYAGTVPKVPSLSKSVLHIPPPPLFSMTRQNNSTLQPQEGTTTSSSADSPLSSTEKPLDSSQLPLSTLPPSKLSGVSQTIATSKSQEVGLDSDSDSLYSDASTSTIEDPISPVLSRLRSKMTPKNSTALDLVPTVQRKVEISSFPTGSTRTDDRGSTSPHIPEPNHRAVLFVEDLPAPVSGGYAPEFRRELSDILLSFLNSRTVSAPLIILLSEGLEPGDAISRPAATQMLGRAVMSHPSLAYVEFPRTTEKRLEKALHHICFLEKVPTVLSVPISTTDDLNSSLLEPQKSPQSMMPTDSASLTASLISLPLSNVVSHIAEVSRGDLRHAIMTLECFVSNTITYSDGRLVRASKNISTIGDNFPDVRKSKGKNRPLASSKQLPSKRKRMDEDQEAPGPKSVLPSNSQNIHKALRTLSTRDDFFESLRTLGKILHAKKVPYGKDINHSSSPAPFDALDEQIEPLIVHASEVEVDGKSTEGSVRESSSLSDYFSSLNDPNNTWRSAYDLESLISLSPYNASTTALFLLEAVPQYYENIEDISFTLDSFSFMDIYLHQGSESTRSGIGSGNSRFITAQDVTIDSFASSIVSRLPLAYNRTPANPGFQPIRKPVAFGVETARNANLDLLRQGLGLSGSVGIEETNAEIELWFKESSDNSFSGKYPVQGRQPIPVPFPGLRSVNESATLVLPFMGVLISNRLHARQRGLVSSSNTELMRFSREVCSLAFAASTLYGRHKSTTGKGNVVSLLGNPIADDNSIPLLGSRVDESIRDSEDAVESEIVGPGTTRKNSDSGKSSLLNGMVKGTTSGSDELDRVSMENASVGSWKKSGFQTKNGAASGYTKGMWMGEAAQYENRFHFVPDQIQFLHGLQRKFGKDAVGEKSSGLPAKIIQAIPSRL